MTCQLVKFELGSLRIIQLQSFTLLPVGAFFRQHDVAIIVSVILSHKREAVAASTKKWTLLTHWHMSDDAILTALKLFPQQGM